MGTAKYGLGFLSLVPAGVTNPTPVVLGIIKKASAKFSQKIDFLGGGNVYDEEAAAGKRTCEGSADFHQFGSATYAAVMSGATTATGIKSPAIGELGQVATNAFTVANGGTFFEDLGVLNTVTGLWMTRGATATGAGVYAVNTSTGAYTFNAADNNPLCRFFYSYTSAATGKTTTMVNQPMGPATEYALSFFTKYGTRVSGYRYPAVVIPDLSIDFGSEEWAKASITWKAKVDAGGNFCTTFDMD